MTAPDAGRLIRRPPDARRGLRRIDARQSPGARRVVSLVPSVTETLFALGLRPAASRVHHVLHPSRGRGGRRSAQGRRHQGPRRRAHPRAAPRPRAREPRGEPPRGRRGSPESRCPSTSPTRATSRGWSNTSAISACCSAPLLPRARWRIPSRARSAAFRLPERPAVRALPHLAEAVDGGGPRHVHRRDAGGLGLQQRARRRAGAGIPRSTSAPGAASLDAVLLSSEPFPFAEHHRAEVAAATGLDIESVQLVSGEAFSWFGCRTAGAFDEAARVHALLDRRLPRARRARHSKPVETRTGASGSCVWNSGASTIRVGARTRSREGSWFVRPTTCRRRRAPTPSCAYAAGPRRAPPCPFFRPLPRQDSRTRPGRLGSDGVLCVCKENRIRHAPIAEDIPAATSHTSTIPGMCNCSRLAERQRSREAPPRLQAAARLREDSRGTRKRGVQGVRSLREVLGARPRILSSPRPASGPRRRGIALVQGASGFWVGGGCPFLLRRCRSLDG